jgi:hypothetical protein
MGKPSNRTAPLEKVDEETNDRRNNTKKLREIQK